MGVFDALVAAALGQPVHVPALDHLPLVQHRLEDDDDNLPAWVWQSPTRLARERGGSRQAWTYRQRRAKRAQGVK